MNDINYDNIKIVVHFLDPDSYFQIAFRNVI